MRKRLEKILRAYIDPNLILDLDPKRGLNMSQVSGKLAQWNDNSRYKNHVSQATVANHPTPNGDKISFDTTDFLTAVGSTTTMYERLKAGGTFHVKVKSNADTAFQGFFVKYVSPTGGILFSVSSAGDGYKGRCTGIFSKIPQASSAQNSTSKVTSTTDPVKITATIECTRKFTDKQFMHPGQVASPIKISDTEYWLFCDNWDGATYNVEKRVGTTPRDFGPPTIVLANHLYGRVFWDSGASLYRMFVNPFAGVADLSKVQMYTSADGNTWAFVADVLTVGTAGQFDDFQVDNCSWFKIGATHYLLYEGWAAAQDAVIGLATSADGITYVKQGIVIGKGAGGQFDDTIVVDPGNVIEYTPGNYFIIYNGLNITRSKTMFGLATSTDLINWTKFAGNPIFYSTGEDFELGSTYGSLEPNYFVEGDVLHMYYRAKNTPATDMKLGYCTFKIDPATRLPVAGNEKVEIKLYVNGQLEGTNTFAGVDSIDYLLNSGADASVGGNAALTKLNGDLYEVKVWDRVLNADEIRKL